MRLERDRYAAKAESLQKQLSQAAFVGSAHHLQTVRTKVFLAVTMPRMSDQNARLG